MLSATTGGGTVRNVGRDRLGSVTALVSTGQNLARTYTYDPHGDIAATSGSAAGNLQFTAGRKDPTSRWYTFGQRTYAPELGRFTTLDPLPASVTDLNRYAYAGCNPANFVDPTGLFSVDEAFSACVFGAFQNVAFAFVGALLTGGTVGIGVAILGCLEGIALYALVDAGYPELATALEAVLLFGSFRGLSSGTSLRLSREEPVD